jgi:addiction module HigA family antidote
MTKRVKIPANLLPPGSVFHPGEFIKDEMEAREMNQIELAKKLKLSRTEINLIIHGKRRITITLSLKLEKLFGIEAEFWMNTQSRYEIETMRKKHRAFFQKPTSDKQKSANKRAAA